jgi:hypothetical protein
MSRNDKPRPRSPTPHARTYPFSMQLSLPTTPPLGAGVRRELLFCANAAKRDTVGPPGSISRQTDGQRRLAQRDSRQVGAVDRRNAVIIVCCLQASARARASFLLNLCSPIFNIIQRETFRRQLCTMDVYKTSSGDVGGARIACRSRRTEWRQSSIAALVFGSREAGVWWRHR